jgi:putative ABC transport system permease protein
MSISLYRLLLFLLPGWFREEFASEMTAVFRAALSDARRHGTAAVVSLWIATCRDTTALAARLHLDALRQDLSYALRTLRRSPAFTLAVVATLALGIGPTLVVANFVERVVIAPLPYDEPDRLVRLWNARPELSQHRIPLSTPDYVDLRDGQSAFDALAAHAGTSVAMVIGGIPRQLNGVLTTPELHAVYRLGTVLGRGLVAADSAPGAPPVIVLGQGLWKSEFGGRLDVIGQVIQVDSRPTTIVGVLEDTPDRPNYWVPLTIDPANATRGTHFLNATGRLRRGVSALQAQEALNVVARGLSAAYPDTNRGKQLEVFGLKEQANGDAPRLLGVLSAAIMAVLLIACLNVASLLTVRSTVRGGELAVRTALGATRRRLHRQLIVEHLVLTIAGGAVGLAVALGLHSFIVQQRVLALPRAANTFGWPAYAFLLLLMVSIGAMLTRLTARRSAATPHAAASGGATRHTSNAALFRLRQGLVIAEVACALVLLVAAGLMLRSAARLSAVDPGFRTDGVLTFGVVLPQGRYPQAADRARFAEQVTAELRALPGVRQAAAGAYAPMGEMRATRRFAALDRTLPEPGAEPVALDLPVGPGYFDVMGITVIDGRSFDERDSANAPPVMVVSREFARRMFPGERALGKQIRFFSSRPGGTPPPTREIVGVVNDVRQDGVAREPMWQMYTPYAQNSWGFLSFFVLADTQAAALGPAVERVVTKIDPMRPARDLMTTDAILRSSTSRQRALTWMLIALAAIALLLATIGLYGVSATAASARSRELAIRAAVGARPGALLRLILLQGLVTGLIGVAIGAASSLAATRGLDTLLFETGPRDPATFAATATLLLAIATLATYVPARRALRANPAEVLRAD